jgi:hypothetical protein
VVVGIAHAADYTGELKTAAAPELCQLHNLGLYNGLP